MSPNRAIGRFGQTIGKRPTDVDPKLPCRSGHRRILTGECHQIHAAINASRGFTQLRLSTYCGVCCIPADDFREADRWPILPLLRLLLRPILRHLFLLLLLRLLLDVIQLGHLLPGRRNHVNLRIVDHPRRAPRVPVVQLATLKKKLLNVVHFSLYGKLDIKWSSAVRSATPLWA